MKKLLKKNLLLTTFLLLLFFCFATVVKAIPSNENAGEIFSIFLSPSKSYQKCIDNAYNNYKNDNSIENKNITQRMSYIFNKCSSVKKRDVYYGASYCYLSTYEQNKSNNANDICSIPFKKLNSVANAKYKHLFDELKEIVK